MVFTPTRDGGKLVINGLKTMECVKNDEAIPVNYRAGCLPPLEAQDGRFLPDTGENLFLAPTFYRHCLPPDLCGRRLHASEDFHIAPAFAQIFQRRRRREHRPRRQRTTFTSEQTLKLELEYNRADYITRPRRFELADLLNLTESQIKIWFQNRRAKDKRIEKAHMDHQLRTMGYSSMCLHMESSHPGTCGVCAVPFPLPLPPRGPVPWHSLTTRDLTV